MKMTDERHSLWINLLDGINDEWVMGAALHIVSTRSDWPPDIALLRTTALSLAAGELAAPSGSEAWATILRLISCKSVPLTPREREALKATGSLYDLRRSSNATADRARFVAAYDRIAEREKKTREMLPGVAALNAKNEQQSKLTAKPPAMALSGESER